MNRDRETINRFLGKHGLATLDNPGGLMQQLGFLVEGHEHLKQLINRCEPQYRRDMYESLRPHLTFEAKPLDVYISELGQQAEAEQLPTLDENGRFQAFRPAEIQSDEYIAQKAVDAEVGKHHLTLTCKKCTRTETVSAFRKADAIQAAREAGWVYDSFQGGQEICPKCPVVIN